MPAFPSRIFLDTNIYIIGMSTSDTDEQKILQWLGYEGDEGCGVQVVISSELLNEVARVAKRLRNKDFAGELVDRIWNRLNYFYVTLEMEKLLELESLGVIPREDVAVYLTAKTGNAQCFVSINRKLVRTLVKQTQDFECLTPEEFVRKYLSSQA